MVIEEYWWSDKLSTESTAPGGSADCVRCTAPWVAGNTGIGQWAPQDLLSCCLQIINHH